MPESGYVALEHENLMKDLGVWIDQDLSFDDHIFDKIKVANRMLGVIRHNFKDLDIKSFLLLYKAMVRSHLEFASSVWNPFRKGLIKDIESVQKRATKLVHACKSLSYKERLVLLKLPTLKFRRYRGDMIEVYKMLNGVYDPEVVPLLGRNVNSRTRGNSFKLKVDRCKLDVRKYAFCNRVVNLWNSLPDVVVTSVSVNAFKNSLDKLWICKDFYYDYEVDPI